MGKPSGLNTGVAAASSPVVVFADARQEFAPDAIRILAANFADSSVGAVSGSLEIASSNSNTGAGVDVYWKLEKLIRKSESQTDSAIGCTGAIYAIRRELFEPIPADTILDDVVIPMHIALKGYRVLFEPRAIAWDPQSLEPEAEQRRKKRTLAGNFQMLFRYAGWLLPHKNRLWWELMAHKYFRLAAPLMLALAFVSNGMLAGSFFFCVLFAAQCSFYLLALVAKHLPKMKLTSLPAGFVFLNLMTVRAFWHYLTSKDLQRWETARR
jgi:cellulose synthase/poly-beta-1,6-N-acetylglucosamine synthase-like glycosyltransferase